jgi:DNA primase
LRQWEQEDFALQPHRRLWAAIAELEEDNLGAGRLEAISRGLDPGHDLADLDLPRLLFDRLLIEGNELLPRLTPLLQPTEVQRLSLTQPLLLLRGAIAVRARLATEKRCRHLLDAWGSQRLRSLEHCLATLLQLERLGTDGEPLLASAALPLTELPLAASLPSRDPTLSMELRIEALFSELNADALRFQEAYYSERRYLQDLDQRRCAGYDEILTPAAA